MRVICSWACTWATQPPVGLAVGYSLILHVHIFLSDFESKYFPVTFGFCVPLDKSINQSIVTKLCFFPMTSRFCVLCDKSINQSIATKLCFFPVTFGFCVPLNQSINQYGVFNLSRFRCYWKIAYSWKWFTMQVDKGAYVKQNVNCTDDA